jgi:DNA-binding transcriptional ArsR family regulator
MEYPDALAALAALAQETRLLIFRRLVRAGRAGENAGSIASALRIPAPTLSFHLKELEHAGLITQRRESRSLIYSASFDGMRNLLAYLMDDCCAGNPEICKFQPKENCNEATPCSPARE